MVRATSGCDLRVRVRLFSYELESRVTNVRLPFHRKEPHPGHTRTRFERNGPTHKPWPPLYFFIRANCQASLIFPHGLAFASKRRARAGI
jgi:hypothetical protein